MSAVALAEALVVLAGATLAGFAVVRLVGESLSRRERLAWSLGVGAALVATASFALGRIGLVPGPKKFAVLLGALVLVSWVMRRPGRTASGAPRRTGAGAVLATIVSLLLLAPFAVEAVRTGTPSRGHPEAWGLAARAIYAGGLSGNPALAASPALAAPLVPLSLAALASAVRAWDPHALALLEGFFAVAAVLLVSGFLERRTSAAAGGAAGVLVALGTPLFAGSDAGLPLVASAFAIALVATAVIDALEEGSAASSARLLLASLLAVSSGTPALLWVAAVFLVLAARAALGWRVSRAALAAAFVALTVGLAVLALGGGVSVPRAAELARIGAVGPALLATAAATAGVTLAGIGLVLLAMPRGAADALIPALLLALALSLGVASAAPLWRANEALARSALALFPAIALVVASRVFAPAVSSSIGNRAPAAAGLGAVLLVLAAVPWAFRLSAGEKRVDPAFVARPTFHASVEPILQAHCQTCHHDGGIAPFSLTSYAGAAERRRDLSRQVAQRRMPPWKAKPGCERFSNDPSLSEQEIATLVRWAESGAKKGDPRDAPPPLAFSNGWELGEPDLVLKAPVFTPDFSKGDLYQCFVLPTGLEQNAWISAVEVRPGNRAMVHHALLYVEEGIQSREREAEGPGPGYPCFGGARVPVTDSFGEWAPGMQPRFYPPGTARFLPRKSRIIMQVHYSALYGKVEPDASEVGVYFAKGPVARRLLSNDVRSDAPFTIPADAVSHTLRGRLGPLDSRAELVAILPHMHLLGKTMKVTARLPGGVERCLVDVDDWDLRWQRTYYYAKPVVLPKGTVLDLEATFDNSYANPNNPVEPHVDVHFGEHTTDEMCMALLFWTVDGRNPGERDAFFKGQVCGTSAIPRPTATPTPAPR